MCTAEAGSVAFCSAPAASPCAAVTLGTLRDWVRDPSNSRSENSCSSAIALQVRLLRSTIGGCSGKSPKVPGPTRPLAGRVGLDSRVRAAAPATPRTMSKVSGQPEGTTLLECINESAVPFPERMSFVRWLEWRRQTGSRPVKRRDGRPTCSADEVALWRSVMDFLHDVKEEDEEEEEEEEEDDEDESPPPEEPVDDLDGPELIPDAGDGLSEAAALEQAAARAAAAAPTAGATGLAAAGDSALAVVPLSADRPALDGGLCACYGRVPAGGLAGDVPPGPRAGARGLSHAHFAHRPGASGARRCDLVGGARRARDESLARMVRRPVCGRGA